MRDAGTLAPPTSGILSLLPVTAAISRAMPTTLFQSGRLGVISRSYTTSPPARPMYSANGFPTGASLGRMSNPSIGSGKPSSWGEHIMPWLVMPKTLRSLITNGSLSPGLSGSAKFGRISGTLSPTLWFCAPQMMARSPLPSLTLQTESLSEPGTLSLVRIWATTIPSNSPGTLRTLSTSSPSRVSRSASCSGDQSKSTYCFSQLRVTFIVNR